MIGHLLSTLRAARPHNMTAAALCVLGGYYVSGGRSPGELAAPLVFAAVVSGLGFLINDYYDAEIDRVNKPARPIPSGRLSPRHVIGAYITGTVVTTILMLWFLPRAIVMLLVAWEVALLLYARSLKRVTLVGNIVVAAIAASAFLGGAALAGSYRTVCYPMGLAFLLVMGRELVKGGEDVEGDRRAGAMTIAVRAGVERTAVWAALVLAACAVAAPAPTLFGELGRPYAIIVLVGVVPGLIAATTIVLRKTDRRSFNQASWILKIAMFVGIIAVVFGAP